MNWLRRPRSSSTPSERLCVARDSGSHSARAADVCYPSPASVSEARGGGGTDVSTSPLLCMGLFSIFWVRLRPCGWFSRLSRLFRRERPGHRRADVRDRKRLADDIVRDGREV